MVAWMISLTLFFAVSMNNDWNGKRILWYGSIALLALTYIIVYRGKALLRNWDFTAWFASFLALCIFSITWSLSPSDAFEVIKTMIVLLAVFLILQFSINYGFSVNKVLICLFAAIVIDLIYVIFAIDLSALGEVQLGKELIDGWNGNQIGFMAGEGLLLGVYLCSKIKNKVGKIPMIGLLIFCAYITVYTGSRTAFIMTISGVIIYICINRPQKIVRNILIIALLLLGSFYIMMNVASIYNILGSRFEGLFALFGAGGEVDGSAETRDEFIKNGISWFLEEPFIGYGINNYRILNSMEMGRLTYAHNNFVEIAVGLGVVGLVLYYSVYVLLIIRMSKKIKNNPLIVFLLSLLLASLISQYGSVSYYSLYQNLLIFLCFASINSVDKSETHNLKL